jgi:hypothetical protein
MDAERARGTEDTMRRSDLGLAVLGAATAVLAVLAVQQVEVLPFGPAEPAGTTTADPATATATARDTDDVAATTAATPEGSAATVDAPTAPEPADLGEVLAQDDVEVVVLGDSTSNSRAEWVELWAEQLGQTRAVTIAHWDETADDGYNDPIPLAEGDGEVTVWSGSVTGLTAAAAAERAEELVPPQPDLVLLSFGRDDDADEVPAGMDELLDAMRDVAGQAPVGVVVQPGGDAETTEAVRAWAESADVAVLDIDAAWRDETPDIGVNDADGNPTAEAAALWAQRVAEALQG